MKTETKNVLYYKVSKVSKDGRQFEISVKLGDERLSAINGHEDFSITGTIYEKGKPKIEKYMISGGACGDEISKEFPEFKIFNDLHLCDMNGAPMYAAANGFYHIKNGMSPNEFCEYFRVNENEFLQLQKAEDQTHFAFIVESLGIPTRWKQQAEKAISELEKLTRFKFKSKAIKSHFRTLTANEKKDISKKIESGFYSDDKIKSRQEKKESQRRVKKIKDKKETAKNKIREIKQDLHIDIVLIENFGTDENVIFYKHKNEIVFNWQDSAYAKKWTQSEVDKFGLFLDSSLFDDGLKITRK